MNSTYLSDEDYDFIYSRVPRICADILFVNPKGHVLMTKRTIEPYIDYWHLPGGRVKFRESVEDALKRVAKAEIGVDLTGEQNLVGYCEYPDEVQKEQPRHSISLVHIYEVDDDIEISSGDKYQWCSEMPGLVIPPIKDFLIKYKFL